jgi:hypothetical protein
LLACLLTRTWGEEKKGEKKQKIKNRWYRKIGVSEIWVLHSDNST